MKILDGMPVRTLAYLSMDCDGYGYDGDDKRFYRYEESKLIELNGGLYLQIDGATVERNEDDQRLLASFEGNVYQRVQNPHLRLTLSDAGRSLRLSGMSCSEINIGSYNREVFSLINFKEAKEYALANGSSVNCDVKLVEEYPFCVAEKQEVIYKVNLVLEIVFDDLHRWKKMPRDLLLAVIELRDQMELGCGAITSGTRDAIINFADRVELCEDSDWVKRMELIFVARDILNNELKDCKDYEFDRVVYSLGYRPVTRVPTNTDFFSLMRKIGVPFRTDIDFYADGAEIFTVGGKIKGNQISSCSAWEDVAVIRYLGNDIDVIYEGASADISGVKEFLSDISGVEEASEFRP